MTKRIRKTIKKENIPQPVKIVEPKTPNQKTYIRSIIENDIIFCTGPSGCGKSFIAAGLSSQKLHHDEIENIIITRPLVCTGKEIGSLPGELRRKNSSLPHADAGKFKTFSWARLLWRIL